jgi:hypothetical protein
MQEPQTSPSTGMSLPARLLNVFAIPGEVFREVKATPSSPANWLAPALLLVLVSWIGGWWVMSQPTIKQQLTEITDKAIQQQIDKKKIPEAQADQIRQYGDIGARINMAVAPLFMAFGTPFFWGLIFWLLGAKVMKADFGYMKAVEVAGLANTIVVLEAIVKTLMIVLSGNLFASPSLAFLVKEYDPQSSLHTLLALGNLMTFWLLIVRAIGFSRLTNMSFGKAAVWVFAIWATYTGLFVGCGMAVRAAFGQ